jgi:hypothetical protein
MEAIAASKLCSQTARLPFQKFNNNAAALEHLQASLDKLVKHLQELENPHTKAAKMLFLTSWEFFCKQFCPNVTGDQLWLRTTVEVNVAMYFHIRVCLFLTRHIVWQALSILQIKATPGCLSNQVTASTVQSWFTIWVMCTTHYMCDNNGYAAGRKYLVEGGGYAFVSKFLRQSKLFVLACCTSTLIIIIHRNPQPPA